MDNKYGLKNCFRNGFIEVISGLIELSAAGLMLYFNKVETAFKINACLAIIGPIIMLTVTSLGLVGLAGKIPLSKLVIILCGVALIFTGLLK